MKKAIAYLSVSTKRSSIHAPMIPLPHIQTQSQPPRSQSSAQAIAVQTDRARTHIIIHVVPTQSYPAAQVETKRSTDGRERGCEGRGGGEEVSRKACFYGGVFPLSQYSHEGSKSCPGTFSQSIMCRRGGGAPDRRSSPPLCL